MNQSLYDNRELSWLKFNQRVLQESLDENIPLMERLSFTSIFQSNLDEFFMVRVGTLYDQMHTDEHQCENKTNMTSGEQLDAIFERVRKLEPQKDRSYHDIMKQLAKHDVIQLTIDELNENELKYVSEYFKKEIHPLLSPLIIDKRHPLPFLKNKDLYIAVHLESKSGIKLGLLPVSDAFKRIITLSRKPFKFILVEDIILRYAPDVFENYKVLEKSIIRITRNADISEDDDSFLDCDFDFLGLMEQLIKKRKKLAPVRMQVLGNKDSGGLKYLSRRLEIDEKQIFTANAPLDLSFVFSLKNYINDPSLYYEPFTPQNPCSISPLFPVADQIRAPLKTP